MGRGLLQREWWKTEVERVIDIGEDFNKTGGRGPEPREIITLCLMAAQKEMDAIEGQASWRGQSQPRLDTKAVLEDRREDVP